MVQEKFIKRGNKLHGPYYYESYRDENGKAQKKYLGTTPPTTNTNPSKDRTFSSDTTFKLIAAKKYTKFLWLLPFIFLIILILFFFSYPAPQLSPPIPETNETNITLPEEPTPPEQSETNITTSETNQTNITLPETPEEIPEEPETNETTSEEIPEEPEQPKINETIPIEQNITIPEEPTSSEKTQQYQAVINLPVKWLTIVNITEQTSIQIPKQAQEISIKTGDEVQQAINQLEEYKQTIQQADRKELLAQDISLSPPIETQSFLKKIIYILKRLIFRITGSVILENEIQDKITETQEGKTIELKNFPELEQEKEIAVEYFTEAPQSAETKTPKGKKITITGPEEIHYENILAYTTLEEQVPENRIKLYQTTNNQRQQVSFIAQDLDDNGLIDYIEWTVSSLSEQTYEIIIEITKAELLDPNKEPLEDIYEQVKAKDNIWKTIPQNHYVRATFESPLDSTRDITLHARISNQSSVTIDNNEVPYEIYQKKKRIDEIRRLLNE